MLTFSRNRWKWWWKTNKTKKNCGVKEPLKLHKFSSKNSKFCYSPFGSSCQHISYEPISYRLLDMAACCHFGVDLRNQPDHKIPFRLTDGIPHSSSDMPSSPLVLLVTLLLDDYSECNFPLLFPLTFSGIYSKSNSQFCFRILVDKIF